MRRRIWPREYLWDDIHQYSLLVSDTLFKCVYYFLAKFLNCMAHIPAHSDVSDMSIKDAPGVAYVSSRIAWLTHFPLTLAIILLCCLHIVITSRKTSWATKHLDDKNQIYTLSWRAFLKTKKKIHFRWTNLINRTVILIKFFKWKKKRKTLQDRGDQGPVSRKAR